MWWLIISIIALGILEYWFIIFNNKKVFKQIQK